MSEFFYLALYRLLWHFSHFRSKFGPLRQKLACRATLIFLLIYLWILQLPSYQKLDQNCFQIFFYLALYRLACDFSHFCTKFGPIWASTSKTSVSSHVNFFLNLLANPWATFIPNIRKKMLSVIFLLDLECNFLRFYI